MLFLSGATLPLLSPFLQLVSNFISATYLVSGMQGIILDNHDLLQNRKWVVALIVTALVGLTVGSKLFRWEKEEKIRNSAKLWVVVALLPFFLLGVWQSYTRNNVVRTDILRR